jgi:hypothetical protein
MSSGKKAGGGVGSGPEGSDEFLEWLKGVPDPRERYRRATAQLERHQKAVEELSSLRAKAAADVYDTAGTFRELANELGVSPTRAHQLIKDANGGPSKGASKKRSSDRKKEGT